MIWFKIKYWLFNSPIPILIYPMTEEPEVFQKQKIYLVGESGHTWYIGLLCPCDCGEVIQLSTLKTDNPKWSFVKHWNYTITINPSIWRISGCKSHFFIRRGIVDWCRK